VYNLSGRWGTTEGPSMNREMRPRFGTANPNLRSLTGSLRRTAGSRAGCAKCRSHGLVVAGHSEAGGAILNQHETHYGASQPESVHAPRPFPFGSVEGVVRGPGVTTEWHILRPTVEYLVHTTRVNRSLRVSHLENAEPPASWLLVISLSPRRAQRPSHATLSIVDRHTHHRCKSLKPQSELSQSHRGDLTASVAGHIPGEAGLAFCTRPALAPYLGPNR
jgi:hypothetical protein